MFQFHFLKVDKKIPKMAYSKLPIFNIFSKKNQRLVLGSVGEIDVKSINVAPPIRSSGCLTSGLKEAKTLKMLFLPVLYLTSDSLTTI